MQHPRAAFRTTLGILTAGAALVAAAQAPPQFRAGVDLVVVDVTVLNRGGDPLSDLGPDDFSLEVDGRPRGVQSVRLVRADATPSEAATRAPAPAGAVDLAPRRFVIVVDREHIPAGEGQPMLDAAARFVDRLAPADRVAAWTLPESADSIGFSADRERVKEQIRRSVGTYRPPLGSWVVGRDEAIRADENERGVLEAIVSRECFMQPPTCPAEVQARVTQVAMDARLRAEVALAGLGALVDALAPLDGPKHVVLVTEGPVLARDNWRTIASLGTRAALARVTVHALQVRDPGHQARPDQMRASPESIDQGQSAAYALATTTGGLAITPAAGDTGFERLERELSASYVLVFEAEASDRDGQVHEIDVKVRRAGWLGSVRARKSFRADPSAARAIDAPPAPAPAAAQPAPAALPEPVGIEPGDLADRLADYAERFEREITAVVAEERFVQIIHPWRGAPDGPDKEPALRWLEPGDKAPRTGPIIARRQLVSDVLLVQVPGQQWQSYRDVAEVDGRAVRDRVDRVQRLFLSTDADRAARFQEIALESARYNIGNLKRDLNLPTVALSLLRRVNHPRFKFKRQKDETVDGRTCRVLSYQETQSPTLISTRNSGDVYIYGKVWIDQADGRMRRTELWFDRGTGFGGFRSCIRVDYGAFEGLSILVPVRMWEWYEGVNQLGRIGGDLTGAQGLATYSKYRRFHVETSERVK